MKKGKYILVNGTFVPTEDYRISTDETEGFLFSERIRAVRTAFPFFKETLELIKLKFLICSQTFPEFTDRDGAVLKRQLERTLTKNKFFLGAVFTVSFRLVNGVVHYSIQSEKLDDTDFELNEKGLFVEVFDRIQKPIGPLSNLSLGSEVYWNIANWYLRSTNSDQLLLLNTEDKIVEAIGSNVYCIRDGAVFGSGIEDGTYQDISHSYLLEILRQLNLEYTEDDGITIQTLRTADEIMLVNVIDGIRWVVGFEGKRYFNQTIRKINELFSRNLTS